MYVFNVCFVELLVICLAYFICAEVNMHSVLLSIHMLYVLNYFCYYHIWCWCVSLINIQCSTSLRLICLL